MIKQYFKQAWRLLKENPVLSAISIIGTALAICMIMVIVMSHEVKNAPYPPETNRDRMLYMKFVRAQEIKSKGSSNSTLGYQLAKEGFKALQTPQAVSIVSAYEPPALITTPGSRNIDSYDKLLTDESFWELFDFSFIKGNPYSKADVDAGIRKAVITRKIAREIFGTTDAVGKTILVNYTDYTICGVVNDVSKLATAAYAQIWIPLTSQPIYKEEYDQIVGKYRVYILAKDKKDFAAIRAETEKLRLKYNTSLNGEYFADYKGQPDSHFAYLNREWAGHDLNVKKIAAQYVLIIFLLLLIPAVNLSSMTGSRMRKRLSELGVRRAYGASKNNLLYQILAESMFQTFIGGLVGLLFSYVAAYAFKEILYDGAAISPFSLFSPAIFLYAFIFCLLLNILSSIIPAWYTSRKPIVESILSK